MSELFEKILIATDGSKLTTSAIANAVELARAHKSKLYIVYVIDVAAFSYVNVDGAWDSIYEVLKNEGADAMNEVRDLANGIDLETFVLEGSPAPSIVRFAQENEIDLIVVGTRGKNGLEELMMGSVAKKVVRLAHCPVLVVKHRQY
ncbi:MAG TPA: universal stress protein [Methanocella sp.]|nr:universal stress protein [Methanocella sp.]